MRNPQIYIFTLCIQYFIYRSDLFCYIDRDNNTYALALLINLVLVNICVGIHISGNYKQ